MPDDFKPTKEETRFLRAYRSRASGETLQGTLEAAKLPEDWLLKKYSNRPEFFTWFKEKAREVHELSWIEIVDQLRDQISGTDGALNPRVLKEFREFLQPDKGGLDVVVNVGAPVGPDETRELIMQFLETLSGGQTCEHCGAPKINWDVLRGLPAEQMTAKTRMKIGEKNTRG